MSHPSNKNLTLHMRYVLWPGRKRKMNKPQVLPQVCLRLVGEI